MNEKTAAIFSFLIPHAVFVVVGLTAILMIPGQDLWIALTVGVVMGVSHSLLNHKYRIRDRLFLYLVRQ